MHWSSAARISKSSYVVLVRFPQKYAILELNRRGFEPVFSQYLWLFWRVLMVSFVIGRFCMDKTLFTQYSARRDAVVQTVQIDMAIVLSSSEIPNETLPRLYAVR